MRKFRVERNIAALETLSNLVDKLNHDKFYIDGHNSKEESINGFYGVTGIAHLVRDDVGMMFDSAYYCLNHVYINEVDDKVHLSPMSIGGVVWAGDLVEKVLEYNQISTYEGSMIDQVLLLDGTCISFIFEGEE